MKFRDSVDRYLIPVTSNPIFSSAKSELLFHSLSALFMGYHCFIYICPFLFHLISGVDDILFGKACYGSTLRLNCSSPSKSIKILYASYGTTPYSSHCGNVPTNTTCQASGALNTVTTLCKHYKSCNIDVSSEFGLSCGAGVVPRLTVYYQCTGTVIKSKAAWKA